MKERDKMIRYFIMDVDGTLTDGKLFVGPDGECFKAFNVKDGCGIINLLPQMGIEPVIVTGRQSRIVEMRCKELGITKLFQGVKNKTEVLQMLTRNNLNQIAYIGDDLNDMEAMKRVAEAGGSVGCPADATGDVKQIAHFISEKCGGDGAVREYIEWLLKRYNGGEGNVSFCK